MAVKAVVRDGFSDYRGVEDSKDIRKASSWGKLKEERLFIKKERRCF